MSLSGRAGAKAVLRESNGSSCRSASSRRRSARPPCGRRCLRTALVNRLRADRSATSSIVAPGGYGKTTLLAQWAARDDRAFAWISLDRRDNDPVVLLGPRRSVGDRRARRPASSRHAGRDRSVDLDDQRPAAGEAGRNRQALCAGGRRPARRGRKRPNEILAIVAEHVPAGSALVLSARTECDLTTKLRSHAGLLEIGFDDLALTRREAELLLRGVGAKLSDADFQT